MFMTPPAMPLYTGSSTGRNSGRSRRRHAAALAVTAAAAAGLLAGCASANTHQAGGVAHAWLQVAEAGNYPAATCQPVTAHWLRVYAPGETQALYVSHAFDACSSDSAPLLTVMPVRSGQGVQGTTP